MGELTDALFAVSGEGVALKVEQVVWSEGTTLTAPMLAVNGGSFELNGVKCVSINTECSLMTLSYEGEG